MFSNDQCSLLVNSYVRNMQSYINCIESEIKKDEPNIRTIANASGKLSQIYSFIVELTGAFTGIDSRIGGFRESTWASAHGAEPKEEED